jgi:3-phenylpropionate/trans-cinnamate dioxygenase ferredoxin component
VGTVAAVPQFLDVCALEELPPGAIRRVEFEDEEIMVVNCGGEILAMEDRCSHDNGDLADGELYPDRCAIECPRHGSLFDLRTGQPLNLPAYVAVETYDVEVEDGRVRVAVE